MRTKVTLVLIFLNVALFFFIFKFERNWRTRDASQEARRRVLGPEAADIRLLDVTSTAAGGSYSLVRNRDTWSLTKPFEWPANQRAVTTIVQELALLEHETAFNVADLAKNKLSLADYGLEKPKLVVTFSSTDPKAAPGGAPGTTSLRIGDTTKDGKRLYVLSPDGQKVHIVNRSLADSLSTPLDRLRADSLLSVRVFEARSLLVQTGGATGIRVRIRRDGTRWTFETPILARASKTAIELTLSELNGLRAASFPAAGPATPPATSPSIRVTLEGNNRQETLYLGETVPPDPGAAAAAPGAPVSYYAQVEGRSATFTVSVPATLLVSLRNAQEALREKRILDFDPTAVTAVTLGAPLQSREPPLILQRLEPPAGQAANVAPPWQVVVRPSGTEGSQTLPADRATVQRLLEQLALATARVFKSDAPTSADLEEWGFNRPIREITLAQAGNQPPIVLRIGTDANRTAYYARVGTAADPGTSIYEIGPELEREFPLSAVAWRDRAVADPLPATARIAAVKLTEIESTKVLATAAFNAAGEASPAPRNAAALQQVVAWLRALRAREFLPGGFSEKILFSGEERPWRYQLEATIALPAPGGAEQSSTLSLLLSDRLGGGLQYAGSKDLNVVFSLEQPIVDALWALAYGDRDPGPRTELKK